MTPYTLTADQQSELTYMTGVAGDGTVAATSFWTWNNDTPATYGATSVEAKWGPRTAGTGGGVITYGFDAASNWTATEQNAFSATMALWSAVANVSFQQVASATGANIDITRDTTGVSEGGINKLYQSPVGSSRLGGAISAEINMDTSVAGFGPLGVSFSDYGGYPWMTLIHEEGHTLGLGHTGPYDGTVTSSTQQYGSYDDRAWSVMSYINSFDGSAKYSGSQAGQYSWGTSLSDNGKNYYDEPTTPMALDILAVQRLYGLPTATPLSGGQTFGFHSNIAGPIEPFFDFTINTKPVVTLWDEGGGNTLDLSGYTTVSHIDLRAGDLSSCAGLTDNLRIGYGVAIDTAVGGSGDDILQANDDGDVLSGGAGQDTFYSGAGNDTFKDTLANSAFDSIQNVHMGDRFYFTDANPSSLNYTLTSGILSPNGSNTITIFGMPNYHLVIGADPAGGVDLTFANEFTGLNDFNGDGHSDLLWRQSGGAFSTWAIAGNVTGSYEQPNTVLDGSVSKEWVLQGSMDFDADSHSDLVWRNANTGAFSIWDAHSPTGFTVNSYLDNSVGTNWTMSALADFSGDGRGDILWRDSDGSFTVWDSTGAAFQQNVYVDGSVGTSWRLQAAADFSGDDKADLLWRNNDGTFSVWDSTGTAFIQNVDLDASVDRTWHVGGVGDFNGDGKADILWRNDNGVFTIWDSTGAGFTPNAYVDGSVSNDWQIAQIGDFNDDGKADILFRNVHSGVFTEWDSTGTGFNQNVLVDGSVGTDWTLVAHQYDVI